MVKEAREDTESHYYSVGIGMEMLTGELVESYYRKGIDPWCWCPDTREEVSAAIASGITLMTVNNPEPALEMLRKEN